MPLHLLTEVHLPIAATEAADIGMLLLGATIGALVTHYLTKNRDTDMREAILDREADIRRREFTRVITRWRCKLLYSDRLDGTLTPRPTFNQAITEIMAEFSMCRSDFIDPDAVGGAIRSVAAVTDAEIDEHIRSNQHSFHGAAFAEELQRITDATQKK